MFAWLKKRAAQQSLFNVRINTETLIAIANQADAAISATGMPDSRHIKKVAAAQNSLLTDIRLALDNGATIDEVRSRIDAAKDREKPTQGADMAISHVLSYIR